MAFSVADDFRGRMWLTTASAARRLAVTTRWVRALAKTGELPCEMAESGQRLFRRGDVQRYLIQRTEDRARRRSTVLQAVRVQMVKAGFEPRQLALFGPRRPRLTLVRGERALPHAEVKAAESFVSTRGSDRPSSVDRKVAGRTR